MFLKKIGINLIFLSCIIVLLASSCASSQDSKRILRTPAGGGGGVHQNHDAHLEHLKRFDIHQNNRLYWW